MTAMTDATTFDLRGLRCPMPLLKLKPALHEAEAGRRLIVLTSDSGAQRDIPAFLHHTNHQLVSLDTSADGSAQFVIDAQG